VAQGQWRWCLSGEMEVQRWHRGVTMMVVGVNGGRGGKERERRGANGGWHDDGESGGMVRRRGTWG